MPLNFTKKQVQILEIFFHDPGKSFYLRQLARMLGVEPGVFQRDINKLEEKGVLLSEFKANSRFFQLNKKYPLYAELKSIFFKTVGAEGKLKELFGKIKNIEAAFIFGSYAEGKEDSLSDIDVMIIGDVNEKEFILDLRKAEEKLVREINYHIYAPEDWAKKRQEKEHFVKEINKKSKIFIIGDEKSLRKIH
ncbi:MAG: nucleotidyltransferase domain-containing protein [Parcubacteria group bacterium]|jgi:predicted nucleotidyltransferase